MKNILNMAFKDLLLMRRDPAGMFFILGFPLLLGLFFGFINGSFKSGSAALTVAVVDEDQSEMSAKFVEALTKTGNVTIEQTDRETAMNQVRQGKLVGMIVLPERFGETAGLFWEEGPAIEVGIDPSRKAEAGMLEGLVMKSMGELTSARFSDPASMRPHIDDMQEQLAQAEDVSPDMRRELTALMTTWDSFMKTLDDVQQLEANDDEEVTRTSMPLAKITSLDVTREFTKGSVAALVQKVRSPWDITFPQGMLWGVLACSAGFAVTLVRERVHGTLTRLEVAPVSRGAILAGKAMACGIAVAGVIFVMVLIGLALGMRPESYGLLVLSSLCVSACFVGIMMLTAALGKTEEAVSGAGWGAYMVMAMFGGGMIPLAFMPDFMKTLSHFSPVKWSILALEGAIWRGFTLSEMLLPCGVLLGIGAACAAGGVWAMSRARG